MQLENENKDFKDAWEVGKVGEKVQARAVLPGEGVNVGVLFTVCGRVRRGTGKILVHETLSNGHCEEEQLIHVTYSSLRTLTV